MRYWVNHLPWRFHTHFYGLPEAPWVVDAVVSGSVKSYDRLTFVEVYDAGHMVPLDKRPEALSLVNWWMGKTRS